MRSYYGATLAEVSDFGHIISREGRGHLLAHLFNVAGDHDGPEEGRGCNIGENAGG